MKAPFSGGAQKTRGAQVAARPPAFSRKKGGPMTGFIVSYRRGFCNRRGLEAGPGRRVSRRGGSKQQKTRAPDTALARNCSVHWTALLLCGVAAGIVISFSGSICALWMELARSAIYQKSRSKILLRFGPNIRSFVFDPALQIRSTRTSLVLTSLLPWKRSIGLPLKLLVAYDARQRRYTDAFVCQSGLGYVSTRNVFCRESR